VKFIGASKVHGCFLNNRFWREKPTNVIGGNGPMKIVQNQPIAGNQTIIKPMMHINK
jgi:hypothetical protein